MTGRIPARFVACNEQSSLTLCQLVADEDWHATVDVGGRRTPAKDLAVSAQEEDVAVFLLR